MKSSAPDEQQFALGKPIRDVPQPVQPQTKAHNADGTIQVDAQGRLSTNITPPPLPSPIWPSYGFISPLASDEHVAEIVACAMSLRLLDTDFPVEFWGTW